MRQIDVYAVADGATFNRFHVGVLFWCALIIIFDGYDLAVAGIALPAIMKDMGVSATHAGFMVSSALFGMMFGAIFLGTIADRIGRRKAIAICILLFSVFTAAAGMSSDPMLFAASRFLAGLGIGGVMPNVVAQMTEYSPRRIRATLVTLMFSGYSVGGMLAALLGKQLLEQYGWQSVFLAAGAPALLVPLILSRLPDSMPFLLRTGQHDAVRKILRAIDPARPCRDDDRLVLPEASSGGKAAVGELFREGRGFSTLMFWLAFFMCLFMVYALSSWLTKLMASAGYSLGSRADLRAGADGRRHGGRHRRRLAGRPHQHQVRADGHVCAGRGVDCAARLQGAYAGAVRAGGAGRCFDDRHADRHLCLRRQFYPVAARSTGIGWASGVGAPVPSLRRS